MPATTSVAHTGNAYTDGLIYGTKWAVTTLTFSFPASASYYGLNYASGEQNSNFESFNPTQQAAVRATLVMYSSVANIKFTEVGESSVTHGDFRYAMSDKPGTAWAYLPTTNVAGGDAWFNNSSGWYDNPIRGNYAFASIVHETGHALGLKHPHEVSGTFAAMPADHDSLEYTVMSYRSYVGASTTTGYTNAADSYPQTLMMYDIAAVQAMYGANYTTNSGDTVYTWSPTTGQMSINGTAQWMPAGNKIFLTIWDGGGNDTYDFSNYTTAVSVNLQPGEWSTPSSAQLANLGNGHKAAGNIANAFLYNNNPASLIENAVGGSGADTLVGNAADNKFTGKGGNDTIDGQGGTNTAVYSGTHTQYAWVTLNGTITVTDVRLGTPDGIDTLTNVQYLQFSDGVYAVGGGAQPTNRAPVAQNDAYSDTAGTTLSVTAANGLLANDSDPDGNAITASLVSGPAHGTLSLASNGSFTYTPTSGWSGTDTFTYRASDGSLNSGNATVTITVSPPANRAPVAQNDAYSTGSGAQLSVTAANGVLANDSDPDGNPVTASLVSGPAHGTLSLASNGSFTYTPASGWSGADTFTYRASDGSLNSGNATVTVTTAAPANRAPVAQNDAYGTSSATQLSVTAANGVLANDSDADGNPITASLVSGPAHGTLSLASNGSFTYTPASGWSGADTFTYRASDGSLNSGNATVTVTTAAPANRAPLAQADAYATAANTALSVTAANGVLKNDSDPDGNPITASLVSGPAHGTLSLASNGSFTYTPTAGWSGGDSFTYRASDGSLSSAATAVSLTVQAPVNNVPPAAGNDEYAMNFGIGAKLTVNAANGLLANDSDANGDPMTVSLVQGPSSGSLQLNPDGSFTYSAGLTNTKQVTFQYVVSDGTSQSVVATATIDIATAFSPAPTIDKSIIVQNDTYGATRGQTLTVDAAHGVLANDSDREGETLTASLVSGPANGSVTLAGDGSFVFTPAANFTGTTSFTYRATDGSGFSTNATATISVSAPSAQAPASAAAGPDLGGLLASGDQHFDLDALFALLPNKAAPIDVGVFLADLFHVADAAFEAPDNMPAPSVEIAALLPDQLDHLHSEHPWA